MKRYWLIAISIVLFGTAMSQNLGIGTDYPNAYSILEMKSVDKGLLIPRLSLADRDTELDAASLGLSETGLLIYNTTDSIFNYWDGVRWLGFPSVEAENGIYVDKNTIRLGGELIESTEITHDNYLLSFNLDGTGNFEVQDNGATKLIVRNDGKVGIGSSSVIADFNVTGESYFSDDLYLMDGGFNSGDDILARLYDEDDDGVLDLYENNSFNIRLHANGTSVFNEQGLADNYFRIETDNSRYGLFVDADDDVVRIGNNSNGTMQDNGNTLYILDSVGMTLDTVISYTVNYVADFEIEPGAISGTAIGIGTSEYIVDMGSKMLGTNSFLVPTVHNSQDLGRSIQHRWDDIFADAHISPSDVRLKKNIKPLKYGLKEVLDLQTISYVLKDDPFGERKLGLVAQEVLDLIPEPVKTHNWVWDEESNDYVRIEMNPLGLEYMQFVPVLIKAMQEQQTIIDAKNDQIRSLSNRLDELEKRILLLEE